MGTRTLTLTLSFSLLLATADRAPAHACGSGALASAVATAVVLGNVGGGAMVQNIVFTVDDLRMAAKKVHPTRNDGAVELALNLPLTIGWAAVAGTLGTATTYRYAGADNSTLTPSIHVEPVIFVPALIGALWSAGLAAHGLWAIATAPLEGTPPATQQRTPLSLRFSVVPTLLRSGNGYAGGLGCAGTF